MKLQEVKAIAKQRGIDPEYSGDTILTICLTFQRRML
jgi:hypothetical protein